MNLRKLFKVREKKTYSYNDILSLVFPGSKKNMINSNSDALEQSVWISRAIRVKAETSAAVPWHITRNKKIEESAERKLIDSNSEFTFTELQEKIMAWEFIQGYGVWYVENQVITPIDADQVEVKQNNNGTYSYRLKGHPNVPLLAENLIIFPNFTPKSKKPGLSELKTCIDMANLGENSIQLANNIMLSGGLLTGMLSTDQSLTPDEAGKLRDKFREKYGGIKGSGDILVAGRGIQYTKLGLSPNEFSVLDVTKITRNGVSVAFGVPEVYLAGTESVDYANSKTQEAVFYKTTVKSIDDKFADRVTRFVLPLLLGSREYKFAFDWSQVEALQADRLQQAQIDEIDIRSGKKLINEIRLRDGLNPVPYGSSFWGSAMLVPIGVQPKAEPNKESISTILSKLYTLKHKKTIDKEKIWKAFVLRTAPQEKRFKSELRKLFEKQEKEALDNLKSFEPEVKSANLVDFTQWIEVFKKKEKPFILTFMQQAGDQTVVDYNFAVDFNLQTPKVQKWIEKKTIKFAKEVNKTTEEALKKTLAEGRAAGEGIPELSSRVSTVFDQAKSYRTDRIARTEVIGANNKASLEAASQNAMKKKTWLTALDENTREEHMVADGQEVDIDKPFIVDGEELEMPGDPNGSPENIINCRCTMTYGG